MLLHRFLCFLCFLLFAEPFVKRRIEGVEIFAVQMILCNAERIAEAVTEEWILRYPLILKFPFDIDTVL